MLSSQYSSFLYVSFEVFALHFFFPCPSFNNRIPWSSLGVSKHQKIRSFYHNSYIQISSISNFLIASLCLHESFLIGIIPLSFCSSFKHKLLEMLIRWLRHRCHQNVSPTIPTVNLSIFINCIFSVRPNLLVKQTAYDISADFSLSYVCNIW